jgi:transposase
VAKDSATEGKTCAINQIKAILVTAPAALRERLGNLTRRPLIDACAALRPGVLDGPMAAAKRALRTLARRIQSLEQEIELLLSDLDSLTQAFCPGLRQTYGVGVDSAATLLTAAGDDPERFRSDAGFAALCGVSPLPASSGKTNRHRLNRGGNRQANAALHRIAVVRLRWDEQTQAYAARRTEEGLSKPNLITQQAPQPAQPGRRVVHRYHPSHGPQCHSVPERALCARVSAALRNGGPV